LQLAGYTQPAARRIFENSDIEFRHLFLKPSDKPGSESLDDLHRRYREGAVLLARQAAERCLAQAGLAARDVDCILVCSCTGYLCPDLSTILVKEMGLRPYVQRGALLGLGCAGALPGLQRAYDHALAYPDHRVLLIAVEICTAAYYKDDTMETLVANAICADGAAACLVSCRADHGPHPLPSHPGPRIMGFASAIDPDLQDLVGFEHREGRLRIILAAEIRDVGPALAQRALTELFAGRGIAREDIAHWLLHPGGRKVIDRVQHALGLRDDDVALTRHTLRNYGNMSSPTVLFVLHEALVRNTARPGDQGVLLALGPGLAAEAALLSW
jgi:predicted naringenin-chalcone synthase